MRNASTFAALAATTLFVCSLACSSSNFDVAGGDATPGVSDDQACTDVANARCNKHQSCSQVFIAMQFGDLTTCVGREKQICLNAHGARGNAGSAEGTEKCAASIGDQTCADVLDNVQTDACAAASGAGADGSSCAFASQCKNKFCALPDDAQCGTCGSVPPPGSSCATSNCAPGLACPASSQTCTALAQNGASCGKSNPCASGLTCVGATPTANGSCVPSANTVGAPCDPLRRTGPGCDRNAGVGCDLATSKCVAVQIVGAGVPCDGEVTFCGGGGTCFFATGSKIGTCVAPAADGAACDSAVGPGCLNPSKCIRSGGGTSGTCVFPDASPCH
jgi:hypothetical protein